MTHLHTPVVQAQIVRAMNTIGWSLIGDTWKPITASPVPDDDIDAMLTEYGFTAPTCGLCQRERDWKAHPMDAYDYSPLQTLSGLPVGWYSGYDGQFCPECMTKSLAGDES